MKILLIAGHGDGDPGAVGNGYREADLTREVVALLSNKLKGICDVTVADTSRNWFAYLGSHSYNFGGYDYVLEVHFNSGGGTGTEIYVTTSEGSTSVEAAIVNNIAAAVGYRNRGIKRKNFRVISRVKSQGVSAALLEVAFIDSASDMTVWKNRKEDIINAIARGIVDGFGLKFTESEEMTVTQYEELKAAVDKIGNRVDAIEEHEAAQGTNNADVYDYNDKNIPWWHRSAVTWAVDKGVIQGDGKGKLGLTPLKLWVLTVLYRTAKLLAR